MGFKRKRNNREEEEEEEDDENETTPKSTLRFRNRINLHTTTVYLLKPPCPTDRPWIATTVDGRICQPLTSKPNHYNLPTNFSPSKLDYTTLAVSHNTSPALDKLLIVPTHNPKFDCTDSYIIRVGSNLDECTLLSLQDDGYLLGQSPLCSSWYRGRGGHQIDDIAIFRGKLCGVGRDGRLYLITISPKIKRISINKTLIDVPIDPDSCWRKRLFAKGRFLYLIVRLEEKVFNAYSCSNVQEGGSWREGSRLYDQVLYDQVLFMTRDYCFLKRVWSESDSLFPGKDCVVFTEGAFPKYGDDCWELSKFGDASTTEDDIAVFCFTDRSFEREGENDKFPKIDWSPPAWVFDAWSKKDGAAESQSDFSSESERSKNDGAAESQSDSSSESERSVGEDEDLDSNTRDEKDNVETQSDSEDPNNEDDKVTQMQSDSDSQDDGDVENLRDLKCPENDKEVTQSPLRKDVENGAIVQDRQDEEDEEATRILLRLKDQNGVTEEGSSVKNITPSIPRALMPCSMKTLRSDLVTAKFEGCDVRSDVVPTLKKIWRNHGNIIKNCKLHNPDMIARALEYLSNMVQILEKNSALSLGDSQANYLRSMLSDLRCMHFKVDWLITLVDKAIKLHESKHLRESLNRISELKSQVEERKAALLEEIAKLDEKNNKLNEEEANVSMQIPFSAKFKYDELLGSGLR